MAIPTSPLAVPLSNLPSLAGVRLGSAAAGIRYQDRGFGMRFGTGGPQTPFDGGLGNLVHLAEPTGGRAFDAMRDTSLEGAFNAIGEEMRNQYGLGFTPAEPAGKDEFHKVEIRLRQPGLKAQARAGYYR